MPEDAAVMDVTTVDTQVDAGADAGNTHVDATTQDDGQQQDKLDGRRQPDALRKRISELRKSAESITDPAQKEALLKDAKDLNDLVAKARGYEGLFPTVREVREVKALLDAVGGRDGFQQMQTTLSEVEQIDNMLSAGDASVVEKLFQEAPQGMPKLVGPIADRFAKESPQEYQNFIAPRAVGYMDQSGFPQAFDAMVKAYEGGQTDQAKAIKAELVQWVTANRQQTQQQRQADPEVERLRQQLAERDRGVESQQVDTAYNQVIDHAGPTIDRVLKPMVANKGLTAEQYRNLRNEVWDDLQSSRNADQTYRTIAPAKQQQGYDKWTEYAKRWTQDHAEDSARAVIKSNPWLKSAAPVKQVTASPKTPAGVSAGKMPSPSEIDYSRKGLDAVLKLGLPGVKSVEDAILSGHAPLKGGGIRKWR